MALSFVNAPIVWAILDIISCFDPSSVTTEPKYLKLWTVSSFWPPILTSKLNNHNKHGKNDHIGSPLANINTLVSLPLTASLAWWLRRPPREREVPGSNPASAGIFSSHTSDLKIGTPVATLPGAWRYRVSTGTGRPGVSIL